MITSVTIDYTLKYKSEVKGIIAVTVDWANDNIFENDITLRQALYKFD